jgi:hypothetical protein
MDAFDPFQFHKTLKMIAGMAPYHLIAQKEYSSIIWAWMFQLKQRVKVKLSISMRIRNNLQDIGPLNNLQFG